MALEDDVATLARNAIFAALAPDALRLLAFSAETRVLRAGDILFRRDEPSNGGFVVLSGSIALDASDHGASATRIARPPTLIGEIALLARTNRPGDGDRARTLERLAHLAAAVPPRPQRRSGRRRTPAAVARGASHPVHR